MPPPLNWASHALVKATLSKGVEMRNRHRLGSGFSVNSNGNFGHLWAVWYMGGRREWIVEMRWKVQLSWVITPHTEAQLCMKNEFSIARSSYLFRS